MILKRSGIVEGLKTYAVKITQVFATFLYLKLIALNFGPEVLLRFAEEKRYAGFLLVVVLLGIGTTFPIAKYRRSEKLPELSAIFGWVTLFAVLLVAIFSWVMDVTLLPIIAMHLLFSTALAIDLKADGRIFEMSLSNFLWLGFLPCLAALFAPSMIMHLIIIAVGSVILVLAKVGMSMSYGALKFVWRSSPRMLIDVNFVLISFLVVLSANSEVAGKYALILTVLTGIQIGITTFTQIGARNLASKLRVNNGANLAMTVRQYSIYGSVICLVAAIAFFGVAKVYFEFLGIEPLLGRQSDVFWTLFAFFYYIRLIQRMLLDVFEIRKNAVLDVVVTISFFGALTHLQVEAVLIALSLVSIFVVRDFVRIRGAEF